MHLRLLFCYSTLFSRHGEKGKLDKQGRFECDPLVALCQDWFHSGYRRQAIWDVLQHSVSRLSPPLVLQQTIQNSQSSAVCNSPQTRKRWCAKWLGASNPPSVSSLLIKMRNECVTHNNNKKRVKYQLSGPVQFIKSLDLRGPLLDR